MRRTCAESKFKSSKGSKRTSGQLLLYQQADGQCFAAADCTAAPAKHKPTGVPTVSYCCHSQQEMVSTTRGRRQRPMHAHRPPMQDARSLHKLVQKDLCLVGRPRSNSNGMWTAQQTGQATTTARKRGRRRRRRRRHDNADQRRCRKLYTHRAHTWPFINS